MDDNTYKQLDRAAQAIYEKIRDNHKRFKCFDPDCFNHPINSHLLQKERIIKNIANRNHEVIFLFFSRYGKSYFRFKTILDYRKRNFYTFPGLCQSHDSKLFEQIEPRMHEELPDLHLYEVKLKFCFRALLNLIRNSEIHFDLHVQLSKTHNNLYGQFHSRLSDNPIFPNIINIHSFMVYVRHMYWEMQHPVRKNFTFHLFELPRIDICCSQVFIHETLAEAEFKTMDYLITMGREENQANLSLVFFTLLTLENKTMLIVGCHNNSSDKCKAYINGFLKMDTSQRLKKISDRLLLPGNHWMPPTDWICSTEFYERQIKPREHMIIDTMNNNYEHHIKKDSRSFNEYMRKIMYGGADNDYQESEINLFDGILH